MNRNVSSAENKSSVNKPMFKRKPLDSSVTGFTLLEVIFVSLLLSILTGFIAWTFVVGLRAWGSGINRSNVRQSGNLAMERMVRELSQAYSFTYAREDEIRFWTNETGTEEVTLVVTGGALTRTADATSIILTPYAQNFVLAYRDLDDDPMNIPADTGSQDKRDDIRVIIVSLILNEGDETVTLTSAAYARNQGL